MADEQEIAQILPHVTGAASAVVEQGTVMSLIMIPKVLGGNAAVNAQAAADVAAAQHPADPAAGGQAPANPHDAGNQADEAELDDDEDDDGEEDEEEEEDEEGREEDGADANNGGQG